MYSCAKCLGLELVRIEGGPGISFVCPKCQGKMIGIGVLRQLLPKPVVNTLWQAAISSPTSGSARCPGCTMSMQTFTTPVKGVTSTLDVCKRCYLIWFDDQELEALPKREKTEPELSPEAKEAMAKVKVELLRDKLNVGDTPIDGTWGDVIQFLAKRIDSP